MFEINIWVTLFFSLRIGKISSNLKKKDVFFISLKVTYELRKLVILRKLRMSCLFVNKFHLKKRLQNLPSTTLLNYQIIKLHTR